MPYYNLKGKREANLKHHENYRKVVMDFLSVKGYQEIASSSIEGCLSDIILKKHEYKDEPETHVELKWDNFSINNDKFLKEISDYFLLYLRHPRKFKFLIFTKQIRNEKLHIDIFEKLISGEIQKICDKIEKLLEKNGEQIDIDFFKNAGNDEKIDFFVDTIIYKADIPALKMAIYEITGDYPSSDDVHLRYRSLVEKSNLSQDSDVLISNLKEVKITNIWRARTSFLSDREIRLTIQYPTPYYLFEGYLLSLYPFENYNPLAEIVDISTIENIQISDWLKEDNRKNAVIALLNRTCKKYCNLIGLYQKEDENIYFYPAFAGEDKISEKWIMYKPDKKKLKERKSKRMIFKKFFSEGVNPIYWHLAINFETIFFDDRLFFILRPTMVFTENGVDLAYPRRAKRVRELYFNDPNLSRNPNRLAEQLFWGFAFFLSPNLWHDRSFNLRNDTEREIEFHLLKILKKISRDYFLTFKLPIRPILKDERIEELD